MADDEARAREERDKCLRDEIEALKSGRPAPPASPREFTDRKAREQEEGSEDGETDAEATEEGGG